MQGTSPTDDDPNTFDVHCTPIDALPIPMPTPTPTPKVTPTPTPVVDPTSTATPKVTPTATPTPKPTATPDPFLTYDYNVGGSATLKTLVTGAVPLTGSAALTLTPQTGALSGPLTLNPTQANLVVLGFIPVTAKLQFVALTPLDGSVSPVAGATFATRVRVKIPTVNFLGLPLVGSPSTCQAKNPSALKLTAQPGAFSASGGGTLSGTFSISDLTGCGFLNGLVSSVTAGSGNVIALKLTRS